jgi:hypothetical protein
MVPEPMLLERSAADESLRLLAGWRCTSAGVGSIGREHNVKRVVLVAQKSPNAGQTYLDTQKRSPPVASQMRMHVRDGGIDYLPFARAVSDASPTRSRGLKILFSLPEQL